MKVDRIQSTTFQSKKRYINKKTTDDIKQLLYRMDDESIVINKNKGYLLKSLSVDGNYTLYDNRTSFSQPIKLALFDVGSKKNQLVIDTETGEIIDSHKSFFSTWNGILKHVSKSVDKMSKYFDNERVIKRNYVNVDN